MGTLSLAAGNRISKLRPAIVRLSLLISSSQSACRGAQLRATSALLPRYCAEKKPRNFILVLFFTLHSSSCLGDRGPAQALGRV